MRRPLIGAGLLALAACGPPVMVKSGGFTVSEPLLERYSGALAPRAAADLKCNELQIRFSVLGVEEKDTARPEQLRAKGCGHEATYIKMGNGEWVMSGNTTPPAP